MLYYNRSDGDMVTQIKNKIDAASVKQTSVTLLIEHSPCCLLAFAAGFVGISFLSHNPLIELSFALFGAVIGKRIGHKYFHKACCRNDQKIPFIGLNKKHLIFALAFGFASWAIHQILIH